jgi:phosphinothricin acetyltransferase
MAQASIRPATEADVAAIAGIYGRSVSDETSSFEVVPPDADEMARRMRTLIDDGFPYLVAERDGRIVGYCYAGPYNRRQGYRNTVEDSVYLAADARRQGIGRALLGRLIVEAEGRGFRQMIALIGGSQNIGSIRLHASLGFAVAGTLTAVGYKHGRWLDSVIMQRPLGAGAGAPP